MTGLTSAQNAGDVLVDVNDLDRVRQDENTDGRGVRTRATLGSSSVRERNCTSGILTLPSVIP